MNYTKLLFPACVADDIGNLYYVTHEEHAIKKLDLVNGKAEYIDNPDGYMPTEWLGVDNFLLSDGNLYLFEQNGKRMLQYSLIEKTSKCFDLKCNIHSCDNWAACTIYNDTIYAFLSFANRVITIDLNSGRVERKEDLCTKIDYIFKIENNILYKLYSCGCRIGNDMWLFTERKQIVLKYNLLSERCMQYLLPEMIKGCIHAIWKDDKFFILSVEGNVYSWDFSNNKTEILFDCKNEHPYPYFSRIAVTDRNIWIIPCFGKDIYIVNLENGKKEIYSAYPEGFRYSEDPNRSKYYGYTEDIQNYYFAMHSANYILIIEKKSGKEKWLKPIEPDLKETISYYRKNLIQKQYDELDFGLLGYLMFIQKERDTSNCAKNQAGKYVWKFCRQDIEGVKR